MANSKGPEGQIENSNAQSSKSAKRKKAGGSERGVRRGPPRLCDLIEQLATPLAWYGLLESVPGSATCEHWLGIVEPTIRKARELHEAEKLERQRAT